MFKIWAKVLDDDRRLLKNVNMSFDEKFDSDLLGQYLVPICRELDVPNPILLATHKRHFNEFSYVKFLPADFVEKVDFACMTIENGN